MANENEEPVFEYKGNVYVRPIGRGICLDDDERDVQLEDVAPEGNWYMEVRFYKRKESPTNECTNQSE